MVNKLIKSNIKQNRKQTILGVAAHPDDLDFGASGTIAKWIKEGAECYYLVCTDGSKGSDDPEMATEKLVTLRRDEQMRAGKVLGVKDVFFLHYRDTELIANLSLKRDITKYIRLLRPDIVVTFDPTLVYSASRNYINHTDHRAVAEATMDSVFPLARDRLTFPEHAWEGLMSHKVKMLYFINSDNYNEVVDVSSTIELKLKALKEHKTQVNKEALDRVRENAALLGQKNGYKYAETFVKITLRV